MAQRNTHPVMAVGSDKANKQESDDSSSLKRLDLAKWVFGPRSTLQSRKKGEKGLVVDL